MPSSVGTKVMLTLIEGLRGSADGGYI
jgi:hypothetical protein